MKRISTLLYLDEHTGCKNYIKEKNTGFVKLSFEKDVTRELNLSKEFAVLFIKKGRLAGNAPDRELSKKSSDYQQ